MRYRPAPALAGFALTAASLVGLGAGALVHRQRARRPRRPLRGLG
jgi:hypothetical protein